MNIQTAIIVILLLVVVCLISEKKGITLDSIKTKFADWKKKNKESSEKWNHDFAQRQQEKEQKRKEYEERYEKQKQAWEAEKQEAALKKGGGSCLGWFGALLVWVLLGVCGYGVYLKKALFDYNGEYAQNRIVYAGDEYGFCALTTFYPTNRIEKAKGFAVTNMTFSEALNFIDSYGKKHYYRSLKQFADEKYLLDDYKAQDIILFSSRKAFEIGKYGHYFVIDKNEVSELLDKIEQNKSDNDLSIKGLPRGM